MINQAVLVGYLTKTPELGYNTNNKAFTRFTVACNRHGAEEGKQQADFISCVAWNQSAENLCKFMTKGSRVGVIGRITTGSYKKDDGTTVYTTDVLANQIQFLETKDKNQGGQPVQHQPQAPQQGYYPNGQTNQAGSYNQGQPQWNQQQSNFTNPQQGYSSTIDTKDDDLPF